MSSPRTLDSQRIVDTLRRRLPGLLAVYAFGSRITGGARADSDLDLAVLVAGYAQPWDLFELSELAELAGCEVDVVDLRAATTVMQHQVLTTGQRWWALDVQADLFEAAMLSEKAELDSRRAGLLADIARTGTVHGR